MHRAVTWGLVASEEKQTDARGDRVAGVCICLEKGRWNYIRNFLWEVWGTCGKSHCYSVGSQKRAGKT